MFYIRLIYNSPNHYSTEIRLSIFPTCLTTDQFLQNISNQIKLDSCYFTAIHKKDGFHVIIQYSQFSQKKIIKGWSLQHYDLENDDQIIIEILISLESNKCQNFIFLSDSNSDSSEEQLQIDSNTSPFIKTNLIASQESELIKLIQNNDAQNFIRIIESQNIDIFQPKKDGFALIHYICYYQSITLLEYYKNKNLGDINISTSDGWTPLQMLVRRKDISCILVLLQFQRLDLNKVTQRGTALHIACQLGHIEIVKLLINQGANPLQKNTLGENCYKNANSQMQCVLLSMTNERQDKIDMNSFTQKISQNEIYIYQGSVVTPGDFYFSLKQRYLVLNPNEGTFQRYKNKDTTRENLKLTIYLKQIIEIKQNIEEFGLSKGYIYTKVFFANNKSMIFGLQNQSQADRWVAVLRQAITYQKNIECGIQLKNIFVEPQIIDFDNPITITNKSNEENKNKNIQNQFTIKSQKQRTSSFNSDDFSINIPDPNILETIKFADFTIINKLGQGAFGVVFLANFNQNKKQYALKILNKQRLIRKKQLKYAVQESIALQKLSHPFIIKLTYAFQTPSNLFLALDYCPGGDIYNIISKLSRLKEDIARFYLAEMLLACEYLHQQNILYRDLKPENILLCEDGHIKITDFGLCKLAVDYEVNTKSFCGSPAYMPPEMLDGPLIGKYCDFYSFGIVMYELMTGLPPFLGAVIEDVYNRIRQGNFRFPGYLSDNAKDLILKFTAKIPQERISFTKAKSHPFFQDIDWNKVINRQYESPILGLIKFSQQFMKSRQDVQYFIQQFKERQ